MPCKRCSRIALPNAQLGSVSGNLYYKLGVYRGGWMRSGFHPDLAPARSPWSVPPIAPPKVSSVVESKWMRSPQRISIYKSIAKALGIARMRPNGSCRRLEERLSPSWLWVYKSVAPVSGISLVRSLSIYLQKGMQTRQSDHP